MAGGAYAAYSWANASFVPQTFQEERRQGSVVSSEIVSLLSDSLKNLEKISEADRNYQFAPAVELVYQEIARTKLAKEKAVNLTSSLDKMAKAVPEINPVKARNPAMQAMSEEVSLISHLVVYNDTLNALLETLRYKFLGDIRYDAEDVQKLISNLNREAGEVNNLNDSFNKTMREFDLIVEKKSLL